MLDRSSVILYAEHNDAPKSSKNEDNPYDSIITNAKGEVLDHSGVIFPVTKKDAPKPSEIESNPYRVDSQEYSFFKRKLIGHGVFAVSHTTNAEKVVAAKEMPITDKAERELQVLQDLAEIRKKSGDKSTGIVEFLGFVKTDVHIHLLTEYVTGGTLEDWILKTANISEKELPNIKVTTDAMARTIQLVQEGFVKITE